jgi:cytoskeletal protein CcmA (bactofilin family)
MGPLTIMAPAVTVNSVKAMGPAHIESTIEVNDLNINGPVTGSGKIIGSHVRINGPIKFSGDIEIDTTGKINGPTNIDGQFIGKEDVDFKINGPLNIQSMHDFGKVKINGPTSALKLTNFRQLEINGKTVADEIQVTESLTISLGRGETVIKKITGGDIEIGQLHDNFFNKIFSGKGSPGVGIIDEIESNGKVELDNVKVKKVIARELYAGENTEIGEYVEIES